MSAPTPGELPKESVEYPSARLDGWVKARPGTELEAIMQAAPFEEPELSNERLDELSDVITAAIEVLDDEELAVIQHVVFGGCSLQDTADRLGYEHRTQVWRIRNTATGKLREVLKQSHVITDHLSAD